MKKIIFILASSFSIINSMEQGDKSLLQWAIEKENKVEQFKTAIINENEKEIKLFLKDPINPLCGLDQKGDKCCLEYAIDKNKTKAAQLLVKKISRKLDTLETVLIYPFSSAGEENNIASLDKLMHLDFSTQMKEKGCSHAFSKALYNCNTDMIIHLINHYPKYIKKPCSNFYFEELAIEYPKKQKIIDTVLSHPKAVKNLEKMINKTDGISYPKEKQRYFELLEKAKEIQKN